MVIDFRFSVVRQKTGSGQVGIGPVHFQLVFPFQILPCGVQGIVEGFFHAQERVYAVRDKQFYSLVSGADKGKYGVLLSKETSTEVVFCCNVLRSAFWSEWLSRCLI